ncbi:hypothetical protein [Taibaiella helva]|uniref:hypothetical protein n=1 Tax=Taibaiella helva TaxID=2301235 RepID=UPI000E573418|nr:hypothetical protein [Taibaiella helva]
MKNIPWRRKSITKQITELLRKKKILIEKLNELLRHVNDHRQPQPGNNGKPDHPEDNRKGGSRE